MQNISKSIFLIYLFCISITAFSQKYTLDSLVYYSKDENNNNYRSAKTQFIYDQNGNSILEFYSYLNNSTGLWTNTSKTEFFYDLHSNDTLSINNSWDSEKSNWIPMNRVQKTHNSNHQRLTEIRSNRYNDPNNWENESKRIFTYDDQNRITSMTYLNWDTSIQNWKIGYTEEYTYSQELNTKNSLNWINEAWKITSKDEFELDSRGNVIKVSNLGPPFIPNDPWTINSTEENLYNSKNELIQTIYYRWDYLLSKLIPSAKYMFTYDDYGNQIMFENQAWDKTVNNFVRNYRTESIYNSLVTYRNLIIPKSYSPDGHLVKELSHMLLQSNHLGYVNDNWVYSAPNKYYYSQQVITAINTTATTDILAYPNPATDKLYVKGHARIYDILGNYITEGTEAIDVSGLNNGVYFVATNNGNSKFIKE
ncbi:MAG: T9SS type A sorting domain-containing protein [Sporocytophaga sp.]|nr:T9SS type A sorting domain-containing protein [Sporocytophaga sp.]